MLITIPPKVRLSRPLMRPFSRPIIHDKSLVAYYVFDREGKLTDLSGKGNHGTIVGATWTAKGRYGSALSFAVDDYVNCGSDSSLDLGTAANPNMTIAFWFNPTAVNTNDKIFNRGLANIDGYYVDIGTNAKIRFYTNQSGANTIEQSTDNVITTGSWQHFVITKSGAGTNAVKIYKNSSDVTGAGTDMANAVTSSRNLFIGKYDIASLYIDGLIDSAMIFNEVKSAIEVKDLYKSGI